MKKHLVLSLFAAFILSSVAYGQAERRDRVRFSDWSEPVNIGPPVNSPSNDLTAVISKNGLALYFSSDRPGSIGGEDIWVARRRSPRSAWKEPVNLGSTVNSGSMDRLRSISTDGRILFFQSNRPGGVGGNDIWAVTRRHTNDDFDWSLPVNLGTVINTTSNEIAANYLFGGRGRNDKFYFSSSRAGGLGDGDVYVSDIPAGGEFGIPANVVELNSPYNESCFWVRDDGLEIFFSSTRAALNSNLDSTDLWVSTRDSIFDTWSAPSRLSINTAGLLDVNPNLSSDWQTMYFTSNRPGGHGGRDIYVTTRRRLRGND